MTTEVYTVRVGQDDTPRSYGAPAVERFLGPNPCDVTVVRAALAAYCDSSALWDGTLSKVSRDGDNTIRAYTNSTLIRVQVPMRMGPW